MKTTTIGVFKNKIDAESAIAELRNVNILESDISYVYTSTEGKTVTQDGSGDVVTGAASGATTGAVLGTIVGLVVANGILPGIGTLFVAGPIAAALGLAGGVATTAAGAMTGAMAGGFVGALVSMGVDETEAKIYEEKIRGGGILISVQSDTVTIVRNIFSKYEAQEIREYSK